MIKIGEFSKLVQVPVATLRYYDQVGLLKPVEVDRFTGYRYYSASQLPRLHRILALKGLGFSLEQIGAVLAEGLTPEQMRGMLRLRHAPVSQQLAEALHPHPEEGGQTLVLCYDTEFKETDVDAAAAFMLRRRVPESGRVRVHEL